MSTSDYDSVRSLDGTRIGFARLGHGPSLVIVHGSLVSSESWLPVARILGNRFTCFLMDRRGHGHSADSPEYCINREYEDIEAVIAVAGSPVNLLGHSYGAICALGVATRIPVSHLVLYEPPLPVSRPVGNAVNDYRRTIQLGKLDDALALGLAEFAGVPPEQIKAMRRSKQWSGMVALGPSWIREVEAIDALGPNLARYRNLLVPTLLLSGTLSSKYPLQDASEALLATLKDVRQSRLEGQGHNANFLNPSLVAERIAAFLSDM